MKKQIKKGFTLVELLFVMAIIAILAGFAIANLKDSVKVYTEKSMKDDAKNVIAQQQDYFHENKKYDDVTGSFKDSDNGVLTSKNGIKYSISSNNILKTEGIDCGDGTIGFSVNVSNELLEFADYYITFNSCTDAMIQTGE